MMVKMTRLKSMSMWQSIERATILWMEFSMVTLCSTGYLRAMMFERCFFDLHYRFGRVLYTKCPKQ
eukprot:1492366-Ditylum_brightwellii.AAC.1